MEQHRRVTCARDGRNPFIIPLGASTPLGAMAIARGVKELVDQGLEPDVIVHAIARQAGRRPD